MESTLPLGCGDARYVILFSCSLSPMPLPSGNIVAGGPLPRSPFFSLLVSSFSSSVSSSFQICCSRRRSSCAFSSAFIACILLRRERAAALSALCSSVSLALQPANAARKRAVLSMSCCSPAPPDVAGSSPAVILFCCSPAPPDVAGALSTCLIHIPKAFPMSAPTRARCCGSSSCTHISQTPRVSPAQQAWHRPTHKQHAMPRKRQQEPARSPRGRRRPEPPRSWASWPGRPRHRFLPRKGRRAAPPAFHSAARAPTVSYRHSSSRDTAHAQHDEGRAHT
jgi:hypothetical protein